MPPCILLSIEPCTNTHTRTRTRTLNCQTSLSCHPASNSLSLATHMNDSFNKPLLESYVYVNESLAHICAWVMSHVRGSAASCRSCQPTHMKEYRLAYANYSCHTRACVMSHVWMSHVTHINASFHSYANESRSCHSYVNESRSHASKSPSRLACISHESVFSHVQMMLISQEHHMELVMKWVISHKWMSHFIHALLLQRRGKINFG